MNSSGSSSTFREVSRAWRDLGRVKPSPGMNSSRFGIDTGRYRQSRNALRRFHIRRAHARSAATRARRGLPAVTPYVVH